MTVQTRRRPRAIRVPRARSARLAWPSCSPASSTFTIDGLDPCPVVVEADLRAGLPAFTIVGLADRSVTEARERVRAAIQNSGFEFPMRRVTVNLAPAHLRKVGPGFDLAIACAILAASGQLPARLLERRRRLRRALARRRGAAVPRRARGGAGRAARRPARPADRRRPRRRGAARGGPRGARATSLAALPRGARGAAPRPSARRPPEPRRGRRRTARTSPTFAGRPARSRR